jgi:LysM repeat protein
VKGACLNRGILVALALLLILTLVACVRPLRDEEVQAPPAEVDVPAPADGVEGGDVAPGPAPDTGEQPAEGPGAGEVPAAGQEPGEQPAPEQPGDVSEQPAQAVTYIVQAGDTLAGVSTRYNVAIEALALANSLTVSAELLPGQLLIIPVGAPPAAEPTEEAAEEPAEEPAPTGEIIHVVQAGENLFRIGLQYGFTVEELAAYNNIPNPNVLDIGQEIRIPPRD